MKKTIYNLCMIAAAAALVAACSKTQENIPQDEPVTYIPTNAFLAGTETKVSLQSDKSLWWDENDAVKVSDGTSESEYTASAAGATTTLVGDEVDESKTYYAVYPAAYANSFSGSTATVEIPYYQQSVKDNFPMNPMVASSTGADRSFAFKNICGLIGFEIGTDDIASVVIYANGGETLTGQVTVDCTSAAPAATVVSGTGQNGVILSSTSAFATGTYWVAVLPQNFSAGITCTMFNTAGEMVQKSTTSAFTLQRSHRVELSAIDGGTATGTYNITNALELRAFLAAAPDCAASVVATLANDIDLAGMTIAPATSFAGTFNGDNHKLLNWTTTSALFADVKAGAVVKNVVIDASCSMAIPDNDDCAFIALENNGTIEGCVNYAPMATAASGVEFTNKGKARNVGAIAALSYGTISNCDNYGSISLTPDNVSKAGTTDYYLGMQNIGGIVGQIALGTDKAVVTDCHNQAGADIKYESTGLIGGRSNIGGVVGGTPCVASTAANTWSYVDNAIVSSCSNAGNISYRYENTTETSYINVPSIGGVAGYLEGSITDVVNNGSITVDTPVFEGADATNSTKYLRCSKVGGVVGTVAAGISKATNNGKISFSANISNGSYPEFVGLVNNPCLAGVAAQGPMSGSVTDCHNTADIEVKTTRCYGASPALILAGVMAYSLATVSDSDNSGEITANADTRNAYVGGVVAYTNKQLSNCHNTAAISFNHIANSHADANSPQWLRYGGVLAYSGVAVPLINCSNSGAITATASKAETGVYVGGVVGQANNGCPTSCENASAGTVTVTAGDGVAELFTGGIAGLAGFNNSNTAANALKNAITLCNNFAKVKVTSEAATGTYVGGVLGKTPCGIVDQCENSAEVEVYSNSASEADYLGTAVGGVVGNESKATSYVQKCTNKSGGDVKVTVGSAAVQVRVGGVVGHSHGGVQSCVNEASSIAVSGGGVYSGTLAWSSYKGYVVVGGVAGHVTGQTVDGTSTDYIVNKAAITVTDCPARLRVGGIVGNAVRNVTYARNEGNISAVSTSNYCQVGGVIGFSETSGGAHQYLENKGNVSVTRNAASPSVTYSGIGLLTGWVNSTALTVSNCSINGTLSYTGTDGADVSCGVVAGRLNQALTIGEEGAPVTIKSGTILKGTAITSSNYSETSTLVGGVNGKTLTVTNVAFE